MSRNVKPMSDKAKSFYSGSIVTAMVVALTGVLTWGLLKAAHVPALEAKSDSQFSHLNKSIEKLTQTNQKTNGKLENLTFQLGEFAKVLVVTKIELNQIKKDCDYNTKVIRKNKHSHKVKDDYDYTYTE